MVEVTSVPDIPTFIVPNGLFKSLTNNAYIIRSQSLCYVDEADPSSCTQRLDFCLRLTAFSPKSSAWRIHSGH